MIKFFRKIRYDLMEKNKTGKYFKYAIGEIVLVVIGILIALQINNLNESKNLSKREVLLSINLKNEISRDIIGLKQQDSVFLETETKSALGIELFYKAKTINDLDSVANLTGGYWNELYINSNTYNEMIGSGNMYAIKNKDLQKQITAYYLRVEADKYYIRQVNNLQSDLFNRIPEFYPFKLITSQSKNHHVDKDLIDITWIHNPNSPTYLAVMNYLESNHGNNNVYRISVYKRNKVRAEKLLADLNKELEIRNK
jgi:hypothetical protein